MSESGGFHGSDSADVGLDEHVVPTCSACDKLLPETLRVEILHRGARGNVVWLAYCDNCGNSKGFNTDDHADSGDINQAAYEAILSAEISTEGDNEMPEPPFCAKCGGTCECEDDSDWYCQECGKGMADNDDGYARHQIAFCSETCADNHDAQR